MTTAPPVAPRGSKSGGALGTVRTIAALTGVPLPLILGGTAAFLIVGFFGYPDDPARIAPLLRGSLPLFVWFCATWLYLQTLLATNRSMFHLLFSWSRSMFCMAAVGYIWYGAHLAAPPPSWESAHAALGQGASVLMGAAALGVQGLMMLRAYADARRDHYAALVGGKPGGGARWVGARRAARRLLLQEAELVLTLTGLLALVVAAMVAQQFLHFQVAESRDPRAALGYSLTLAISATGGMVVGCVCLILATSLSLLTYTVRVATGTWRIAAVLGYTIAPALSLINAVMWATGATEHAPFFQPNLVSLLALLLFVFAGGRLMARVNGTAGAEE